MNDHLLPKTIRILFFLALLVFCLVHAKAFLVPIVFAGIFSMLLLPLSLLFEKWGISRGLSILISVLIFMIVIAGLIYIVSWQISDFSSKSAQIEENITKKLQEFREYLTRTFGISRQRQDALLNNSQQSEQVSTGISHFFSSLGAFVTSFILFLVYIFLFLYFRSHIKKFILMLVPSSNRKNAQGIIDEAKGVSQKYISGLSWMILCLWIMYGISFSIIGVEHAILFAIICGLLEIIPFVGNITGNLITIIAVIMQGGSSSMILGIIISYAIIQFLQTYLLEPLVVGRGVNINPLFTIAGIVAGEQIWGIPGMVLAIPLMGIAKIICDHIEPLKPYGFLIGEEKKSRRSLLDKVRKLATR